jgi:hypothetical protein
MLRCVVTVSQPGEHKIAGKWFEVPQSIESPHASFLQLAPSRFADPDRAADPRLRGVATGADRVALRSAAPGGATPHGPFGFSEPQWQLAGAPAASDSVAEGFEQEVTEEDKRHRLVLQALHDVEAENRSLREELRRRGKPDPASWTLKQEVFARNISSLPREIAITPGMI